MVTVCFSVTLKNDDTWVVYTESLSFSGILLRLKLSFALAEKIRSLSFVAHNGCDYDMMEFCARF